EPSRPLWIFVDLSLHVNSDYGARSFGNASQQVHALSLRATCSHRVRLPVGRAFRVMKLWSSIVDPESKLSYAPVVGLERRQIIGALCPSQSLVSGVSVVNIGDVFIRQSECDPVKEMAAVSAPLRPQLLDQSPVAKTRKRDQIISHPQKQSQRTTQN